MRALPVLLVVPLLACTGGGGTGSGGGCVAPGPGANPSFSLVGAPVNMTFSVGSFCDPPTSVDFSVYDPSSDPVMDATVDLQGADAIVTFTPTRYGLYQVTVRFQPNLGIAQDTVRVAPDLSGSPVVTIDNPPPCAENDWELTASGLVICLSQGYVFLPAGNTLVPLQDLRAIVEPAGNTLWTGQPLQRWAEGAQADGGRGFSQSLDAGRALGPAYRLFATAHDVVHLSTLGTATRVTAVDGGYLSRGYGTFGLSAVATLTRVGDVVYSSSCALDLETGDAGCDGGSSGTWRGFDRRGLWIQYGFALRLIGPSHQTLAEADLMSLNATASTRVGDHTAASVELAGIQLVPVATGGTVEFEYWGANIVAVTPTTVVSTASPSGSPPWRFYRR